MTVGELRALLADYPDDMDVHADIHCNDGGHVTALRDVFNWDRKFDRTVLSICRQNYGEKVGMPYLSDEEFERQRDKVLDGLADVKRPWKWATRKYTTIHGDHRIYYDHGGSQDTCYGTAYDYRVFDRLESEGLIERVARTMSGLYEYAITSAGMAEAEKQKSPST